MMTLLSPLAIETGRAAEQSGTGPGPGMESDSRCPGAPAAGPTWPDGDAGPAQDHLGVVGAAAGFVLRAGESWPPGVDDPDPVHTAFVGIAIHGQLPPRTFLDPFLSTAVWALGR